MSCVPSAIRLLESVGGGKAGGGEECSLINRQDPVHTTWTTANLYKG